MAEAIQQKLKAELEKFSQVQKDVSKSMSVRQKLETQLTENNIVKEQDLDEAKATVTKRLEYITGEIQRYEALLKDMEKRADDHREVLTSLQQELQKAQGRTGGKL
ncbi:Prefoldin subunit 6 [Oryzias melastigma]|uniref:Prefoldin subunit 6 n=1 Tax=Oryzias melastigma TaxID=30732 RepID=A0A834C021_ORYME|nr:Prefoldin subunit 6 [Oryzias melastigma]